MTQIPFELVLDELEFWLKEAENAPSLISCIDYHTRAKAVLYVLDRFYMSGQKATEAEEERMDQLSDRLNKVVAEHNPFR